jgi:Arc/MetJ-type ribon-helix-helix transcriptional regulator
MSAAVPDMTEESRRPDKDTEMPVTLPESQMDRVRSLMSSGEFADETAVVAAALDLLERRQRFQAMVQEGIDSTNRGELIPADEVFGELRAYLATLPEDAA